MIGVRVVVTRETESEGPNHPHQMCTYLLTVTS